MWEKVESIGSTLLEGIVEELMLNMDALRQAVSSDETLPSPEDKIYNDWDAYVIRVKSRFF